MWHPPGFFYDSPLTYAWCYKSTNGKVLGWVARYDSIQGKRILPYFRQGAYNSFLKGSADKPRPLYGLNLLSKKPYLGVLVVEGEKCARALHQLGYVAVSPPFGANSVQHADFSPLNGRVGVCILPDNDNAGMVFADSVATSLAQLPSPPRTLLCNLLNLPPKGDCVDFFKQQFEWDGYSRIPDWQRRKLHHYLQIALKSAKPHLPLALSPSHSEHLELKNPTPVPKITDHGKSLKEMVKERVDLTPLVEAITPFVGKHGKWNHFICPFHHETKGSFGCLRDYFYCLGCGEKGDSIDFIKKVHHCGFFEALTILAHKLHIKEFP